MSPDSMHVRLHLYRIRVVEVVVDLPERLEVVVKDLRSIVRCPFCGFKTSRVHETRRTKLHDVPRACQRVTLIWRRRRFHCTSCGERHTETHPAFEGKLTARLSRQIAADARHLSITEISRRYGLSWHTVMTMVRAWSQQLGDHRRKRSCRVLLVDETSLRRRHRYVTVCSNAATGELLGVVRHRDFRALSGFLAAQGHRWLARVEVVVTDGSLSYRAAIERHLGPPPMSWITSTSLDGSPRVSPRCAGGVQRVGEPGSRRRSRRSSSEPATCSWRAPTSSPPNSPLGCRLPSPRIQSCGTCGACCSSSTRSTR